MMISIMLFGNGMSNPLHITSQVDVNIQDSAEAAILSICVDEGCRLAGDIVARRRELAYGIHTENTQQENPEQRTASVQEDKSALGERRGAVRGSESGNIGSVL